MKKQGGSSEPPFPARSPEEEISSGSPTALSGTVHPVKSQNVQPGGTTLTPIESGESTVSPEGLSGAQAEQSSMFDNISGQTGNVKPEVRPLDEIYRPAAPSETQ